MPASPCARPPLAFVRRWWLEGASNEEAFALWMDLGAESPALAQEVATLAGQPFAPPTTPALILAGERDAVLSREALRATAAAYQTQLTLIPDAPHLLVRSRHWPDVMPHLTQFIAARTGASHANQH